MYNVTQRATSVKQPYGGYIKLSQFEKTDYFDGIVLNDTENIHPTVIGLAVDYLTRYAIGTDKEEAFRISLMGAERAEKAGKKDSISIVTALLSEIDGITDTAIINACKLVTFDVWKRNVMLAYTAKDYKDTNPDKATIQNIHTLVSRSIAFFEKFGPIVKEGFTFEPAEKNDLPYMLGNYGGYSTVVSSGDGDFLTADTLWDFKVSKSKPSSKNTLQLLMYWIMGQHSGQKIFNGIDKIGIFNPRLNDVYLLDMKDVPEQIINVVEREVICY